MTTSILSGIIGGAISVVLVTFISSRIRGATSNGELKYGWGLLLLGLCCLAFVGLAIYAFFYDNDVWEKRSELLAAIGLILGFGLGALYSFAEYFKVYGSYDNEGITFYTPWTGLKNEKWTNLKSIKFSSSLSWYVLKFKSGKIIRLSSLLGGHGGVLQIIENKGYKL